MPIITGQPPQLEPMLWGLVPGWSRDRTRRYPTINARAETVAERPDFRSALRYRRCLVPASGFYEWRKARRGKQPYYIHLPGEPLFAFAGLWDHWYDPNGDELRTYTIITTTANALMAPIHERMPVILPREVEAAWLDPAETRVDRLRPLLRPLAAEAMAAYSVSNAVNDAGADGTVLIEPAK
jgi:putative SOS response-associated peptidase YedK